MQLIGQLFQVALKRRGDRVTIVGATSGDTGSAAIEAFRGLDAVDVFILFPHGRVSEVQRRQMTTPADSNVHALAVDGDFRRLSGRAEGYVQRFRLPRRGQTGGCELDQLLRAFWRRWCIISRLPQALAHRIARSAFTVPTGNFGDIFAGYIAKRMGLPIDRLVVATNQNDILHRCLSGEGYFKGDTIPSISPSMDIQVSSNFERALYYAYGEDGSAVAQLMDELKTGGFNVSQGAMEALRENFDSGRVSEDETLATIKSHAGP